MSPCWNTETAPRSRRFLSIRSNEHRALGGASADSAIMLPMRGYDDEEDEGMGTSGEIRHDRAEEQAQREREERERLVEAERQRQEEERRRRERED